MWRWISDFPQVATHPPGGHGAGSVASTPNHSLPSWDARLAHWCVTPLARTALRPNHVTTLSLLAGIAGAGFYALGSRNAQNWGAGLYILSIFLDHCDGELARLTGATSAFGHAYDRAADLIVKLAVFVAMGAGLGAAGLGTRGLRMGMVAGTAFVVIFLLRSRIAALRGRMPGQPGVAGFEIEDILYLVAPITWLGWLPGFLSLAAVGAPGFALWTLWEWCGAVRAGRR